MFSGQVLFSTYVTRSAPVLASGLCARLKAAMSVCSICDGVGLVRVRDDAGRWVSRPCACQEMQREERRLAAARIPARYKDCTLDAFDPSYPKADESLSRALLTARRFV